MLRARYIAAEALTDNDREPTDEEARELADAAKLKDLAQAEVDSGFPILHEQSTVFLWGALEALLQNFCAAWLENRDGAWHGEQVRRLRVRLGEYQALPADERSLWVISLLDQEIGGPLRAGINRFEGLLAVFGLDGAVAEECRKTLFELAHVRNVIVHRRGYVDRRLIAACPWLGLAAGEKIRVSHKMWSGYAHAVAEYVLEMIQRVRVSFGLPRYERSTPKDSTLTTGEGQTEPKDQDSEKEPAREGPATG